MINDLAECVLGALDPGVHRAGAIKDQAQVKALVLSPALCSLLGRHRLLLGSNSLLRRGFLDWRLLFDDFLGCLKVSLGGGCGFCFCFGHFELVLGLFGFS